MKRSRSGRSKTANREAGKARDEKKNKTTVASRVPSSGRENYEIDHGRGLVKMGGKFPARPSVLPRKAGQVKGSNLLTWEKGYQLHNTTVFRV